MDGGDAKPGPGTNAVRDKFARIYAGPPSCGQSGDVTFE
jgi:hypothetical protein